MVAINTRRRVVLVAAGAVLAAAMLACGCAAKRPYVGPCAATQMKGVRMSLCQLTEGPLPAFRLTVTNDRYDPVVIDRAMLVGFDISFADDPSERLDNEWLPSAPPKSREEWQKDFERRFRPLEAGESISTEIDLAKPIRYFGFGMGSSLSGESGSSAYEGFMRPPAHPRPKWLMVTYSVGLERLGVGLLSGMEANDMGLYDETLELEMRLPAE